MRIKSRSLHSRVFIHCVFGAFAGLFLLHPFSMMVLNVAETGSIHTAAPSELYSSRHLIMALYFGLLGAVAGVFRAFYVHKWVLLYKRLERLSFTDALTSLYNRRYFDEQLRTEIERARRYSRNLSLLLIDIDRFKHFNDTYGHRMGDSLLNEIASILRASVRKPDFVSRYGGDEFVIVMPETGRSQALEFEQRIYEAINNHPFHSTLPGIREKIGVSIGTASFPEDARDPATLFNRADENLYRAKAH